MIARGGGESRFLSQNYSLSGRVLVSIQAEALIFDWGPWWGFEALWQGVKKPPFGG